MKRWPSVTRRHIDFLFNREETVMHGRRAILDRMTREAVSDGLYDASAADYREALRRVRDGDHQLPSTDDDRTGEDV